jgi:hypothetical protein
LALLAGADDQHLSGGVDYFGCDGVELVDVEDPGDLGHQSFDESEVPAGDAADSGGGFDVVVGGSNGRPTCCQ